MAVVAIVPGHPTPKLFSIDIPAATKDTGHGPVVLVLRNWLNTCEPPIAKTGKGLTGLLTKGLMQFRSINRVEPQFDGTPAPENGERVAIMDPYDFAGPRGRH